MFRLMKATCKSNNVRVQQNYRANNHKINNNHGRT